MGQVQAIPLGAQSYQGRSTALINERLINMYVEQAPQGSKAPAVLYGTPGLASWKSGVGSGSVRGMHVMAGKLYVVMGQELYSIDSGKSETLCGTIGGSGHVYMADNGTHVAVATNTLLYAGNESGVEQLPESGMNGATYQDGYGIFTQAGTQNVWITNVDDMLTIGGTDFTTADAQPDNVMGCISDHREVWVFKQQNTEIFQNTGNTDFPFERIQMIERGCAAPASIAKQDNAIYWLGDDLAVYAAQGYQPQRISTPAIEKLIEGQGAAGALGFTYRQEGHVFYVLTFDGLTVVYDTSTGRWHERQSYTKGRWRANGYAYFAGKHLVGDFETNEIYELDLDTYDENGAILQRTVQSPVLQAEGQRMFMPELYVDLEAGVGLGSGQGSQPTLMLDWSDDGGGTWSNVISTSMGEQGNRNYQARFTQLGSFYQRTLRFRVSDPVKCAFFSAKARLEVGM